ncbi:hypothetical protein HD806DRAFT_279377 [Xylariaceae sp. AK1471]|nr:hypothetical protein HD806DRAFT_279377 [Xylariaceae sp. AK1471]
MESIKRFFSPKKSKSKSKSKKRPRISSPVNGSFEKLTPDSGPQAVYSPRLSSRRNNHVSRATTTFTPEDRGRAETIAWLNTGTSQSLATLLTERDQAAKQIRRGPKTKGTKEVQLILHKPSRKAVEQLHRVRRQAEMVVRYGAPGIVAYNFSKSLGWNQASASKLPPLQLRDFGTRMREIGTVSARLPAVPFTPITWLVLPTPTAAQGPKLQRQALSCEVGDEQQEEPARSWSPVSEPGGWRDSEKMDIADSRLDLTQEVPVGEIEGLFVVGEEEEEEEEGEGEYDPYDVNVVPVTPFESEATAIKVASVSSRQIRQVHV